MDAGVRSPAAKRKSSAVAANAAHQESVVTSKFTAETTSALASAAFANGWLCLGIRETRRTIKRTKVSAIQAEIPPPYTQSSIH